MCFLLGFWFGAFRLLRFAFARVLWVARWREMLKFGVMVFSLLLLLLLLFLTVSRFLLSCAMLFTF
jgi:hypothetical protein